MPPARFKLKAPDKLERWGMYLWRLFAGRKQGEMFAHLLVRPQDYLAVSREANTRYVGKVEALPIQPLL